MAQTRIISQPLRRQDLETVFRSGIKPPSRARVGVEWEKIGVLRRTGEAISYSGEGGVKAIFRALEARFGWKADLSSSGEPIALQKGAGRITLEPGGQIELSGQPHLWLRQNAKELVDHLREIRSVSEPMGVSWLGIGAQPFSTHAGIEWVPKDRYGIMRKRLEGRGSKTFWMMKETASTQVSFDYFSETDAIQKLRLGLVLSPYLTAIFANSPIRSGRPTRYLSRRADIWRHTDPDRSGIPWCVFEKGFDFSRYSDFALSVPILFIKRAGRWLAPPKMSFERFLKNGWGGYRAIQEDWELHLTSIFTEARLKTVVEVRSIDCQSVGMGLAAVAFLKGLFYGVDAQRKAWEIVEPQNDSCLKRLLAESAIDGMAARCQVGTIKDAAIKLLAISENGLLGPDRAYLEPLKSILRSGESPAQTLLSCYRRARTKKERLASILRCAAI